MGTIKWVLRAWPEHRDKLARYPDAAVKSAAGRNTSSTPQRIPSRARRQSSFFEGGIASRNPAIPRGGGCDLRKYTAPRLGQVPHREARDEIASTSIRSLYRKRPRSGSHTTAETLPRHPPEPLRDRSSTTH